MFSLHAARQPIKCTIKGIACVPGRPKLQTRTQHSLSLACTCMQAPGIRMARACKYALRAAGCATASSMTARPTPRMRDHRTPAAMGSDLWQHLQLKACRHLY